MDATANQRVLPLQEVHPTHYVEAMPPLFRETLERLGMPAIDEWWNHLDAESRAQALQLWRDCSETGQQLEFRVEAYNDENAPAGFWSNDYYEYLVNHELYFVEARTFHVCTRHPQAADAVRCGSLPASFTCPLKNTACPIRSILGQVPGKTVRLQVRLVSKAS